MFVTFTDWEFDNIELAQKTAEGMWPKMQAAGASSFKATQTSDKTVRTMSTWPDSATAQATTEKMRAAALEQMSGKVSDTSGGELMLDLS